ncbi:hypothetical protein [Pseudidiomarina insulisalsae]|nr:hypothetical protein [Pseudidiomarina insulisalsae]
MGLRVFHAGFGERVGNRLGLAAGQPVIGLGLSWDGFDPSPYCDAGAPLLITYQPKTENYDPEQVMFWSKVILREMLSNYGKYAQ